MYEFLLEHIQRLGKAAWLKGEQAHDGRCGLLRNFHVREAALQVISIYIYWEQTEDKEELQSLKGNYTY